MDTLRVRTYNVLFGDAILVSVPDRNTYGEVEMRHILIDVGNVLCESKGGLNEVFKEVVDNILEVLDGQPLDLYVMTHEHLDHVQGLPFVEKEVYEDSGSTLLEQLDTRYAWLTASAKEDYYETHSDAKKRHLEFLSVYNQLDAYLRALKATKVNVPREIGALWMNNNPNKTSSCVKYLRGLSKNPCYVHREFDVKNAQPFNEAKIEIWAPEEDTSEYYGRFSPLPLGLGSTASSKEIKERIDSYELTPPAGVDAGAFYDLVDSRNSTFENLLTIDKAANNTSVVFCLEWRGHRLLFAGDAEERSWKTMDKYGVLKPVDFLKVSHHGSCTGTPESELLKKIFPSDTQYKRRCAIVSTYPDSTYKGVPDENTLDMIRDYCDGLYEVYKQAAPGKYFDIKFEDNTEYAE